MELELEYDDDMDEYEFTVYETSSASVIIKAGSYEEAEKKMIAMYNDPNTKFDFEYGGCSIEGENGYLWDEWV